MEQKFEVDAETSTILEQMAEVERAKRRTIELLDRPRHDLTTEGIAKADRMEVEDAFNRISATLGVLLQEHVRNALERSSDDHLTGETIII